MFLVPNVSSEVRMSAWSFLEMTQVSPWQDPMSEVLKRLFPPLSFSDLSQSLVHSLPLLVTPDQGGSVCGTEEADPRKGAALHTDSIQLHSALLSLPGRDARDARDARALEALKLASFQNVHQTSCELNANGSATIIYIYQEP